DGRLMGGADAIVEIARNVWWGWPLFLFAKFPGTMPLLRSSYLWIAARRSCLSYCPNGRHNRPQRLGTWSLRFLWSLEVEAWSVSVSDWLPLLLLPVIAFLTRDAVPAWVFMWLFAFAIFLGCKWLTWRRACRRGCSPSITRSLGYLFTWPGMDATP